VADPQLALAALGEVSRVGAYNGPHLHLPLHLHLPPHLHQELQQYLDRVHVPAIAVIYSLVGALCYAASAVLQQRAAAEQPDDLSMRIGLLVRLLRSWRWMLGNLLDVCGYVFQFLALRHAALAVVSPLFVIGLVFSVIGAALAARRRPTLSEGMSSVAVAAGLALFIVAARPGPGHPHASTVAWVALFATTAVVTGGATWLSRRLPTWRAIALGAGSGVLFGVTSAVTERTGHLLNSGVLAVLSNWAPYVLAVLSIIGLVLNQSAFQAGDIRRSLPVLTIAEPTVAILIGQLLFGEHIASSSLAVTGEVVGLIVMALGVIQLARLAPTPEPALLAV
jgi:drug/metabolite transporter (DMT)-like permease